MSRWAVTISVVVALALFAGPVWAHNGPLPGGGSFVPPPELAPLGDLSSGGASASASPQAIPPFWILFLVVHAAALVLAARFRRGRAALLAVALLVFSVEATVHSVHHLGEVGTAHGCAFATAAGQLSAVPADGLVFDHVLGLACCGRPIDRTIPTGTIAYPPSRGRAPPTRTSV